MKPLISFLKAFAFVVLFICDFSALSATAGTVNNDSVKLVRVAKFDGQLRETWQSTQEITSLPGGAMLYDFGQDAFGQIELTLFSETDECAIIKLGECLIPNGDIDRNPGGTRRYRELKVELEKGMHTYKPVIPKDERNTGSSAILMPEEIGEVMPFRYCEVESKYRPEAVRRIMITCPFNDETSYFHCDNDTLNNVWDLCKYSIKATSFTGYYIDGDRERIPYEADALINQLCHYSTDAQYDVARRTFEHLLKAPTWPTEWIMQMDMIAYNDYLFTGNTELIRKHYDELVAHTLMALRNDSTGLITTRSGQTEDFLKSIGRKDKISDIVDWPHSGILGLAKGEGGEDDGYEYTDFNTVVNAYHYKAVASLAEMADAVGKKEDAKRFRKYCSQLKRDINRQLLDQERGIYVDGIGTTHSSLHANMFALAFGLVPEKYKASVADFIVGRGMRCSVYGAQFLLEALYEAGRADEALKLMTSDSDRSWINMLREGSTITMEAWGNKFKPNQDWNHAWGAAPANIIPMRLMGIQPLKPDFVSIRIHPQLSTIRNAECHFPTPKGIITVIVKNGKMTYDVPKGMKVLNK